MARPAATDGDPRLDPAHSRPSERLLDALDAFATERSRRFWNGYVHGSPPFLGVPMGDVRRVVRRWWKGEGLDSATAIEQRVTALSLFEGEYAEERLAGILALAEHIGADLLPDDLPSFARLFERGLLADWNLTDWFSIKVLAPMIERDPEPPTVARAIAEWRSAETLWQRRSACVAFVPHAREGGAALPELPDLVEATADALVMDPQRFAQTGVGWVMRELAKAEPARVLAFADRHLERLSTEAIRSLGKGLPNAQAQRLGAVRKTNHRA